MIPSKLTLGICLASGLALSHVHGQSVLFSDDFNSNTAANWSLFQGSGNNTPDYTAEFAFDYGSTTFVRNGVTNTIPPSPNGGGTTKGLKLTVNNNDETAATSAVSLYPTAHTFSGNYSLRFDMWMNYNGGAWGGTGSTESATFGVNHVGDKVNWNNNTFPSDGIWFAVSGEGG
ncbi:MAG: hypothetical protein ACK4UN_14220, partial [Limisphaerales bacterium]